MLTNIDAVLFDLDGSLVDSMWLWEDIDIAYLGRYGITLPGDLQGMIEGMSFSETAAYFKERFCLPRSEERRVGKECREGCRSRWSPSH